WWSREGQREVAELALIACPYCPPPFPVLFDAAKLMNADGCLDVHHVVLVAAFDNVVVSVAVVAESPPRVLAHAVEGEGLQAIRQLLVRREAHPSRGGRDVLRHIEAEATEGAECAGVSSFVQRLDGMCAVFDQDDSTPLCDPNERIHVAGTAGEMYGQNGPGPARESGLNFFDVKIEGNWIDVHENGASASVNNGVDGRAERQRRSDHFIPGGNTCREETQMERCSA